MNVLSKWLLAFTIVSATSALVCPSRSHAQDVHGILRVVKGDVQIKSNNTGQTARARIGETVYPKDVIITGKEGRAKIVMVDNNEINVSPESQIEIQHYEFDPNKGKKDVLLNVIYGKVRSKVEQHYDGKTSKFQVKTPAAVAGVRGTDFITSFNQATNSSQVVTFRGSVEFGLPGPNGSIANGVAVTPGKSSTSASGQAPTVPAPVPKEQLNTLDNESKAETGGSGSKSESNSGKSSSNSNGSNKGENGNSANSNGNGNTNSQGNNGNGNGNGSNSANNGSGNGSGNATNGSNANSGNGSGGGSTAANSSSSASGNSSSGSGGAGSGTSPSTDPSSGRAPSSVSAPSAAVTSPTDSGASSGQPTAGSSTGASTPAAGPSATNVASTPTTSAGAGSMFRPEDFAGSPSAPVLPVVQTLAPPTIPTVVPTLLPTQTCSVCSQLIQNGNTSTNLVIHINH